MDSFIDNYLNNNKKQVLRDISDDQIINTFGLQIYDNLPQHQQQKIQELRNLIQQLSTIQDQQEQDKLLRQYSKNKMYLSQQKRQLLKDYANQYGINNYSLIQFNNQILVNDGNQQNINYDGLYTAKFKVKVQNHKGHFEDNIFINYTLDDLNEESILQLIEDSWDQTSKYKDACSFNTDIQEYKAQLIYLEQLTGDKQLIKQSNIMYGDVDNLQGQPAQAGIVYRNPVFNDDFTEIHQQNYPYVEFFQGQFAKTDGECYEIIYNDLGLPLPETKQTPKQIVDLIYQNQEKLNYLILNEQVKSKPSSKQFQRQVYISQQFNHIWISKKKTNLIKPIQLKQDKIYNIVNENELQEIYADLVKNNIVPYYVPGKLLYYTYYDYIYNERTGNMNKKKMYAYYRVQNKQQYPILDMFKDYKTQRLVDYQEMESDFGLPQWQYDFNACYASFLQQLPQIYKIIQIRSFQSFHDGQQGLNNTIQKGNYYHVKSIQGPQNLKSLIICNYVKGYIIQILQNSLQFEIDKEIVVGEAIDNPFNYKNPDDYDKLERNKQIGMFIKRDRENVYYLGREKIVLPQSMCRGDDLDLSFLHCQMLNQKMLFILKFVPYEKITCIYRDSIGFEEQHDELLQLNYIDTNRPAFKKDLHFGYFNPEYKYKEIQKQQQDIQALSNGEQIYIRQDNCLFSNSKKLNNTLIQAFAGSGKTYYCKQYLSSFRQQRRFKDTKCLVLVPKISNIQQYREYLDVAEVKCYQQVLYNGTYECLKSFDTILLDEVYMMDAQFVWNIFQLQYCKKIFIGDMFQQINLQSTIYDYAFLMQSNKIEQLTENHRNHFNYQELLSDDMKLVEEAKKYSVDIDDPDFVPEQDTIYITLNNKDMLRINQMYEGDNLIIGTNKNFAQRLNEDCYLDEKEQSIVRDINKNKIENYYGNAITCYRCQGLQWPKIKIDSKILKMNLIDQTYNISNIYVALSRLQD